MKTLTKCSSVLLLGVCIAALSFSPQAYAGKKGCAGQTGNAYLVNASWAYDWNYAWENIPGGVEYVPMWWSYYGASQADDTAAAQGLRNSGAQNLLTYNEPDHTDQANLTTAYALQGYKQAANACTAAGLGCISPACADDGDSWMQQFMSAVSSQGVRCDAVAVHAYQRDPNGFLNYIDYIHNLYGKNLWITEFAPTDWASPTAVSTDEVISYMQTALPGLASRSYVSRYSWYCGTQPGNNVLQTAALFNSDGSLTTCGYVYQNVSDPAPANGTWRIINRKSGKALDAYNNGTANGTQIDQWTYNGGNNQRWTLTSLGSGQFKIIGVQSGKALDVYNSGTANGTKVELWTYGGGNNQKWTFTSTSGFYRITPVHDSSGCLDVNGASTANGANVQLWTYGGGNNQKWWLAAP